MRDILEQLEREEEEVHKIEETLYAVDSKKICIEKLKAGEFA